MRVLSLRLATWFALAGIAAVVACGGGDGAMIDGAPDGDAGPYADGGSADGSSGGPSVDADVDGGLPSDGGGPAFSALALSAARQSACAITSSGELRCWGGRLTSSSSVVSPGWTFKDIAVGNGTTCAIRSDGLLFCWLLGATNPLQRDPRSFAKATSGATHQCAIASTGALYCWGDNARGQLGVGDMAYRADLTQVGTSTSWTTVAAGGAHSCALDAAKALYCWGDNAMGQLGDGGGTSVDAGLALHHTPTPIAQGTTWLDIAAAASTTCGVASDRSLLCWGNETGRNAKVPTAVDAAKDWARVRTGGATACAVKTNGALYCWGQNDKGQAGSPTFEPVAAPTQLGTDLDWADVAVGMDFACATKKNGTVHCWGSNSDGQLALGIDNRLPTKIGQAADWKDVAAGHASTCGVRKNGELACWGTWPTGKSLGPLKIGTDTNWEDVTAGPMTFCARKTSGLLYCWGSNGGGMTGTGPDGPVAEPTTTGLSAQNVSIGDSHTCAVSANSLRFCWGQNSFGKTGGIDTTSAPLQAGTDTWKRFAASRQSTCGIRSDGTMVCWGFGFGVDASGEAITDATTWTDIAIYPGGDEYYGIRGGTVWTWEWNDNAPAQVGAETTWKTVTAGLVHQCATRTNGTLACRGSNSDGQLGDGTTTFRSTFTNVGAATDWTLVSAGAYHTCGIRNGGELYCWGENDHGQLGDESAYRAYPSPVK